MARGEGAEGGRKRLMWWFLGVLATLREFGTLETHLRSLGATQRSYFHLMYGMRYCRFYSCLCSTSFYLEKKKQSRFKLYSEDLKHVVSVKLQANLTNAAKYSNFTSKGLLYSLQNLIHEAACQEVQAI